MKIANTAVLVTGANRGLGRALVEKALRRGAKRVYAGTRQPLAHSDERVTPLTLDVTNAAQIQRAVESVESLNILINNNAGVALKDDLSDRAVLEGTRTGSVGLADLWVSTRQRAKDRWSAPTNVGRPVNSEFAEIEPGLSHNGRTLLFSASQARGGIGLQDIWMSTREGSAEAASGCPG